MVDKPGRNDPCRCGSGKKYKNCCLPKEQQKALPLGMRKIKAKVISGGGIYKQVVKAPEQDTKEERPLVDYALLMERSFGGALHAYEETPPAPANPSEYLVKEDP